MNPKALALCAVAIVAVAGMGAYLILGSGGNGNPDTPGDSNLIRDYVPDTAGGTFVDGAGRTVTVPDQLGHGIVTIGSTGPLRFASLFDVHDLIIEVDRGDVLDMRNGRAYSYAYDYTDLPYHADNTIDNALVERLGETGPSLVITSASLYRGNADLFDTLAGVTTVVAVNDQDVKTLGNHDTGLDSSIEASINMLGTVFGQERRAAEVIEGIESIIGDLHSLGGTSSDRVYVAGVTISGSNVLTTTFPTYVPFALTGCTNAYAGDGSQNRVDLTAEQVGEMIVNGRIDMIVLDPSSSDKIKENQSQHVLEALYRVNNDSDPDNDIPLYVTVPIVWDSINYDCALASAYYIAHLVYGTLTPDGVEDRIVGVFTTFYGENGAHVLDDMRRFFEGKSSDNGQEMPLLGKVEVAYGDGAYRLVAAD